MKKMIIPAVAVLLFCGTVNAQVAQKTMAKGVTPAASKTMVAAKPVSKTASVAPTKTTTKAAVKKTTAITRKHHHKARKPKMAKQ